MKKKKTYEVPATKVVEVKSEKFLCGSNNTLFTIGVMSTLYNSPFTGGGEDW